MAKIIKKAFDNVGISKSAQTQFRNIDKSDQARIKGICGDPMIEPIPEFISTKSEKIIKNSNNSWIVLGRDRWGMRCSGYGGRGDTQAGSIDIVVGRMSANAVEENSEGEKIWVDPNFRTDAARIYISQKTDVDLNFGLAAGSIGSPGLAPPDSLPNPDLTKKSPRSAIALKADGLRFIAREGIKLITRTDGFNSQGGSIESIAGVDIIAGNDDSDLQPMVKGKNLLEAFRRVVVHIDDLNGIVDSLLAHQTTFNEQLANHFHFSPFWGIATTPSPAAANAGIKTGIDHFSQTKRSLSLQKANLANFRLTYLEQAGDKYINSRYNNSN